MAGLGSIIQAGTGLTQSVMGAIGTSIAMGNMKDMIANRPQYEIPEEVKKMLSLYQQGQDTNLPGYDIAKGNLQEQTAMGAQNVKEMGGGISSIGAVADLYNSERKSMNDLALSAAQYKAQAQRNNMQNYGNALKTMADYQERKWEQNELTPWSMKFNMAQNAATQGTNMINAGMSNLGGGGASLGSDFDSGMFSGATKAP